MRASLVWGCLRLARLPSLPPPVVDPEAEARFTAVGDELLAGDPVAIPEPRLDFLRWLAENRPVVFHGSPRDDLRELSTERQSRDATAWGNQQAVLLRAQPRIGLSGPVGAWVALSPVAANLCRGRATRGRHNRHGAPRLPRTGQAARPDRRHTRRLPVRPSHPLLP